MGMGPVPPTASSGGGDGGGLSGIPSQCRCTDAQIPVDPASLQGVGAIGKRLVQCIFLLMKRDVAALGNRARASTLFVCSPLLLDAAASAGAALFTMGTAPPVDKLRLVTPYPHALDTKTELRLKDIMAGKPAVLHLFTG